MALKEKQEGTTPAEVLPKEGQRTQEPVPATMPPMQDDGALTRAVQAERERTTQIDALCARFGIDDKTRSQYLSEGQTVDQVRAAILERLSAERTPVATGIGRETGVTVDELDTVRAAAADGLLIRAGYAPEKPADGAGEFAGMSFSRIAVECLSRSGLWCVTVVGIPVGVQCFKFAALSFFPFGKEVVYGGGAASFLLNVIWLFGVRAALGIGASGHRGPALCDNRGDTLRDPAV